MSTPPLADLAAEERATPEQILASALALYAALPTVARSAALDALRSPDPGVHAALVHELMRTVVAFELRQRRERIRQRVAAGEIGPLPDLSDEEVGAEAVRLVKESRERRAAQHGR